jgi:hypothetical protein
MAQQHLAPDQMVALRDRICAAVMAQARQLGSAQHMPPCAGVGPQPHNRPNSRPEQIAQPDQLTAQKAG